MKTRAMVGFKILDCRFLDRRFQIGDVRFFCRCTRLRFRANLHPPSGSAFLGHHCFGCVQMNDLPSPRGLVQDQRSSVQKPGAVIEVEGGDGRFPEHLD